MAEVSFHDSDAISRIERRRNEPPDEISHHPSCPQSHYEAGEDADEIAYASRCQCLALEDEDRQDARERKHDY